MNRWQVCLVNNKTKQRKTILYSKFLMSIKLGRILSSEEEVDHIDNDKTNDSIENLQILSKSENRKKLSFISKRNKIELTCPNCKNIFIREKRQTHLIKGGTHTCCSRKCSGQYQHKK